MQSRTPDRPASFWADLGFLVVLGLLLAAPLWAPLVLSAGQASGENRRLAELPAPGAPAEWKNFPPAFDRYVQDHFPLRLGLVRWMYRLRVQVFGETVFPSVVVGKEGWLYFTGEGNMDTYQQTEAYSPRRLEVIIATLRRLQKSLERQGIVFWVVITPAKESIYSPYLPDYIRPLGAQSKLDALAGRLESEPDLHVLDLRQPLVAARQAGQQVFYRTDTHWNDLGAFIAYQQIMQALASDRPDLQPHPLADFKLVQGEWQGDLARTFLLGVVPPETTLELAPTFSRQAGLTQPDMADVEYTSPLGPDAPVLLIFGDSFMGNLTPFLAEHFGRTLWKSQHTVDLELIRKVQPQVVIYGLNERYLDALQDNLAP